jgi:polar amino acid transport system substrate-binding protein
MNHQYTPVLSDEERAATVTQTLKDMDADGAVKTLIEKYADQGMSYENWVLGTDK